MQHAAHDLDRQTVAQQIFRSARRTLPLDPAVALDLVLQRGNQLVRQERAEPGAVADIIALIG